MPSDATPAPRSVVADETEGIAERTLLWVPIFISVFASAYLHRSIWNGSLSQLAPNRQRRGVNVGMALASNLNSESRRQLSRRGAAFHYVADHV